MSEWISVKEQLPTSRGNYIGVVNGQVTECNFNLELGQWLSWQHDKVVVVECWQPLPAPPPKPDAFEEWWRTLQTVEGDPSLRWVAQASTKMWRGHAKVVWDTALASKKD